MRYRIRETRGKIRGLYGLYPGGRVFVAERQLTLFGVPLWWWPVQNATNAISEAEAKKEMAADMKLREPLQPVQYYDSRDLGDDL